MLKETTVGVNAFVMAVLFMGATISNADNIIVRGKQYSNVLVYESTDYYYVKIPREGKSLSVNKSEVPDNQILINEDPYYRQQLRELYDDVKLRGAEAALKDAKPTNPAFAVESAETGDVDTSALFAGGGGGGKPLSISIEEAKGTFAKAGVTLSKSGSGFSGKSSDGILSVSLSTAGGKLTGVSGNINSTDQGQVMAKVGPIIMLAGKAAPWAQQWIMSSQSQLMSTGSIQKAQGGVAISLSASATGISFKIQGQ